MYDAAYFRDYFNHTTKKFTGSYKIDHPHPPKKIFNIPGVIVRK